MGPVFIIERDGTKRPVTSDDLMRAVLLHEANPRFSVTGSYPCLPGDMPPQHTTLLSYYLDLLLSRKTMLVSTGTYSAMETAIQMTKSAWGIDDDELKAHPRVFTIVNVNSPLAFDANMAESMFTLLKYRQPVSVCPAAMAGSTAPVTIEGTIAQSNAECIGVLALGQLYAPGAPMMYGSQTGSSDMRSLSMSIGSPEAALCYKYAARMAKFYGIPCRGGGLLSDARNADVQAGYESMLGYIACAQNGIDLVTQAAGVLEGYLSFSFDKLLSDFEVIDFADKYLRDLDCNEETIPLETMESVGHDGAFVTEEHTMDNYADALLNPNIAARGTDGPQAIYEHMDAYEQHLLQSYKLPDCAADRLAALKPVMEGAGIDTSVVSAAERLALGQTDAFER